MEQMMACMLAEIRTNREKMDANQAEMDANLKELKTNQAKVDANLKEIRAGQELLREEMMVRLEAKQDASCERMMARMDFHLGEMDACLGKMQATDLEAYPEMEANPEQMKSVAVHEEVPKEEATVERLEH
jgi:hypothetical protein